MPGHTVDIFGTKKSMEFGPSSTPPEQLLKCETAFLLIYDSKLTFGFGLLVRQKRASEMMHITASLQSSFQSFLQAGSNILNVRFYFDM